MSLKSWVSIPWAAAGPSQTCWHKHNVPYSDSTYLHTFDIWVPRATDAREAAPAPAASDILQGPGPWIVYIHGGIWRQASIDATSFEATSFKLLLAESTTPFAGIVSLNYPLSMDPNDPNNPSPPKDPSQPLDAARIAKHPDHILAVITALSHLQNDLGIALDYIIAGHSAGACMAFQVAVDSKRWSIAGNSAPKFKKPSVVVGLNGLYDLTGFIHNPPKSHVHLLDIYKEFTRGAFGDNEQVWKEVCPTSVVDWSTEWPEGELFFVVYSEGDELVPYSQTHIIKSRLKATSKLPVKELRAGGGHNDLLNEGNRLTEIFLEVLTDLSCLRDRQLY